MSSIDLTQMITAQDKAATALSVRAGQIKAACNARILAVIDTDAQINLVAAMAAETLGPADLQTCQAALAWVHEMRNTCRALVADPQADWQGEAAWPAVPEAVAGLVAQF